MRTYSKILLINSKTALIILFACLHICCACKSTRPEEISALKTKAAIAEQQLKISIADKKDVSKIVPKMKQVKVLADNSKIKDADTLLDEILLDFQTLNKSHSGGGNLFANPKQVSIIDNPYNAMEPFISRDGEILFFNSDKTDTPKSHKNIYYSTRVDDTTFKFMGEVRGINSNEVDGVPTMDVHRNFYYVSTKNYNKKNHYTTVYRGKFIDGEVQDVTAIPELSLNKPGWLNMDIEISADGNTIYATQTLFENKSWPKESNFFSAHLQNGKFKIDENSKEIFRYINTDDLEYAASVSTDELEIFFTRLKLEKNLGFSSYYSSRLNKNAPFGEPTQLEAINGYSEAPAITDDGNLLYFHKKNGEKFYIYVLQRLSS